MLTSLKQNASDTSETENDVKIQIEFDADMMNELMKSKVITTKSKQ